MGCLALFAVGALYGCSLFTITLSDDDRGSIQRLSVGDLLVIRLTGNASTGYEWARAEPVTLEGSPVEVIAESEYQPLGIQPVGTPGAYVFRYRAMRPGTLSLRFECRRPWDPNDVIDDYVVTIWVQ